jgi:acetyl esterase
MNQEVAIPPELLALMAEIGPRWASGPATTGATRVSGNVALMVEQFSAVLAHAPQGDLRIERDIAYGEHARQRLDVYAPQPDAMAQARAATGANSTPVLIFVHGGAFTDGEKDRTAQIYSNVPRWFARQGVLAINMEYRNAPDSPYPAGSEDVGLVVAWARAQAARWGADPQRVFIMGQSAGGAHTGSYAYDRRLQPRNAQGQPDPGIAGHIVVSGRMRADNLAENPNARKVEAYYGVDAARYEDVSSVNHVDANSVPTFIAVAEFENPLIDVYCAELFWRLAQAQGGVDNRRLRWLQRPGHNHTSLIAHFNTADSELGQAILEFMYQAG